MQFSPIEIKERLTRALDEDNNVSDIPAVLEVIATLESYPITREALEQTRLGKLVNELRKKTTNDDLARRAKRLVRSWQKLISPPTDGTTVNGERINTNSPSPGMTVLTGSAGSMPVSPASLRFSPGLVKSSPCGIAVSSKNNSPCLRVNATPGTPRLHPTSLKVDPNGIQRSNISPKSVCPLRGVAPLTSTPKGPISPKTMCPRRAGLPSSLTPKQHSPSIPLSSTPKGNCPNGPFKNSASSDGRCENNLMSNQTYSPTRSTERNCMSKEKNSLSKVGSLHPGKCSPIINHSRDRINAGTLNDQKPTPKGKLSNRKRTCNDSGGAPPAKRSVPADKYVKDLHSKEKTVNGISRNVCQNLETLEKKKSGNVLPKSKSVMDNLFTYMSGDSNDSFKSSTSKRNLTFHAKQDKTKTSKVKTTAQLIAELRAKSGSTGSQLRGDIIDKLKRQPSPNSLDVRLKSGKHKARPMLSQTKTELVERFLKNSIRPNLKDESEYLELDPCRLLECDLPNGQTPMERSLGSSSSTAQEVSSNSNHLSLLEIYNSLPPLNLDKIDWDDDKYEVTEHTEPITDSNIDRLHNEYWSGVNGQWDSTGSWRDWTHTMSVESFEGSKLDLLPYVNID
ncbi:mediator of RNA polymerase II transcription subunit 26 isoform X1 [Octopus bimaculoides]|uniref:Mediator of RNA polymerase II transcription subunit 26 n=2 Tax=Octopus bimaculoides TaxID=37653 RepID=A0A0L8IFU1_OCTBM|nr:mediator of RNA polymerase II transcription subunit 26 isoform X1 [Octopus bimaculoides]|eukprot:XP_014768970.1 PREDICTED: mediator of RNA polymerase II transcription subunit 26-like [Octopus bimaculoides]